MATATGGKMRRSFSCNENLSQIYSDLASSLETSLDIDQRVTSGGVSSRSRPALPPRPPIVTLTGYANRSLKGEDRCQIERVTIGGEPIVVAFVADGHGGSAAAQLCYEMIVPNLVELAEGRPNRAVMRMACTACLQRIHQHVRQIPGLLKEPFLPYVAPAVTLCFPICQRINSFLQAVSPKRIEIVFRFVKVRSSPPPRTPLPPTLTATLTATLYRHPLPPTLYPHPNPPP